MSTKVDLTQQHRVQIKLKTNYIWDIDSRLEEVQTLREWICEQCDWDKDRFEIRIHSSGSIMDVWFENETDAIMCTLRWA